MLFWFNIKHNTFHMPPQWEYFPPFCGYHRTNYYQTILTLTISMTTIRTTDDFSYDNGDNHTDGDDWLFLSLNIFLQTSSSYKLSSQTFIHPLKPTSRVPIYLYSYEFFLCCVFLTIVQYFVDTFRSLLTFWNFS